MGILTYIDSPVGPLTLAGDKGALTHVLFGREDIPGYAPGEAQILDAARRQLTEYFAGSRREFDLPLAPTGTQFQLRVWEALRAIPYGETISYKQLAERSGSPRGYRAVGMANHNNPISIIVPCHRVVGSNGSLTGYGGGLDIKERLLRLEGARL